MEDGEVDVVNDEPLAKRIKIEHDPEPPLSASTLPALSPLHYRGSRLPQFELLYTLQGHTKGVSSIRFSPDGKYLATAGADGQLLLYDVTEGVFLRDLRSHIGGINDVAWSPDGRTIASCSDDKTIRIWSPETGDLLKILRGHTSHVFCVAWAPQGNVVISGSFDETMKVWDVKRGTCIRSIPAHSDPITAVQCNRDGTIIASCSWDGLIRMWDAATGQCLKTVVGETNPPVASARFSPNSKYLLAATLDSTLRLWDYTAEKSVKEYTGHTNVKYCTAPEFIVQPTGGAYIATGSEDGKVVLWDVQTTQPASTFAAHEDAVISIAYSPTQSMLATSALQRDEARVKVWIDTSLASV